MAQFENDDDPGYISIKYRLQRWMNNLETQDQAALSSTSRQLHGSSSASGLSISGNMTLVSTPPSEGCSYPSSSSSGSSFVKIPSGGNFIMNEKLVKLPFKSIPRGYKAKEFSDFQPREKEMHTILTHLVRSQQNENESTHRSLVITGLGGVGKTQLALGLATRYSRHFDAVFFVVADSESRLSGQYSTIAHELGLVTPSDGMDQNFCSESFRTWLGNPIKGVLETPEDRTLVNWLLVLDNAENSQIVSRFWPEGRHGSILLTTRNPLLASPELEIAVQVQLQGFSATDATRLLRLCAKDDKPNDMKTQTDASTIADWIDYHPMAIDQLGRIIHDDRLSISMFRELYPTKSNLYARLYIGTENQKNIVTTLALQGLQEQQVDIFTLLSLISMLDPEGIEHIVLKPRKSSMNADGSPTIESQYIAYRKQLADKSLIEVDRDTQEVRMHRVVQAVAMDMMVRHGSITSAFNDAVSRVADNWPFINRTYVTGSATKVGRWAKCRRLHPHIVHLKEVHKELVILRTGSLASVEFAELLLEAAQYKLECGSGDEAAPLIDAAEEIYESKNIDGNFLLESSKERGNLYRARIGLAISSKNFKTLLKYAQLSWEMEDAQYRITGNMTSFMAVACNDLAVAWACHEEWENAIALLNQSKSIRKQLPGFTKDKLFSPLYHLGVVLHHQGKYDEAEKILDEAIGDREAAFGLKDALSVRSAALFYARGNVRFSRGDTARQDVIQSLYDHREAVSRARRSAGPKNRTTLICEYQVARVSAVLGEYEEACELLENILSISIDKPEYQRDIARTSYLYANCLKAIGRKRTEYDPELLRSLEVYNKLRPNCKRTADTLAQSDIDGLIPYDYL